MEYNWDTKQIRKNKLKLLPLIFNPKIRNENRAYLISCFSDYHFLSLCCRNGSSVFSEMDEDIQFIDEQKFLSHETYHSFFDISEEVRNIILNSQNSFSYFNAGQDVIFTSFYVDDEEIVKLSEDFYEWIGNKKYRSMFFDVANSENHLLRFIENESGKTDGNVYTIFYPNYNPYTTIEKSHTIQDFCSLNHEVAHCIFCQNDFPNIRKDYNFLSELEGHFFDFLSIEYLKNKVSNDVIQNLKYDRLEAIYDTFNNFLITHYAIQLFQSGKNIDFIDIQKNMWNQGFDTNLDESILISSLSTEPINNAIYITSFLTSLDLENIYQTDPEFAFYLLEKIRFNQTDSIIHLLTENHITFMEDNYKNLRKTIQEANRN